MKIKTVNVRDVESHSHRRDVLPKLRVFVEDNPLSKACDKWGRDNGVLSLTVKSKAWSRIGNLYHRMVEAAITRHFHAATGGVKFSRTCGCSCGCSPGFICIGIKDDLNRKYAWVKVIPTAKEVTEMKAFLKKIEGSGLLEQDRKANEEFLAARKVVVP